MAWRSAAVWLNTSLLLLLRDGCSFLFGGLYWIFATTVMFATSFVFELELNGLVVKLCWETC